MTEDEWLTCAVPGRMAAHLWSASGANPSRARKLRLVGCACVRAVWQLLVHDKSRHAVEVAERYADRTATADELWDARRAALALNHDSLTFVQRRAADAAQQVTIKSYNGGTHPSFAHAIRSASLCSEPVAGLQIADLVRAREALYANFVRDAYGNPFRPVAFDPAWRTDTAVTLARQMYDTREFGAMPILADALQDAGCEDEAILTHCRDANQVHVRGCWVCDLVLGFA